MSDSVVEIIKPAELQDAARKGPDAVHLLLTQNPSTKSAYAKEQQVERAEYALMLARENPELVKMSKEEKLAIITAARIATERLHTEVESGLRTKADAKMEELKKRIETTRSVAVNDERKESTFVENLSIEKREIGKEIEKGDWKTYAKYGAVALGAAWLAHKVWASTIGDTEKPGFLRKLGKMLLLGAAGVAGVIGLSKLKDLMNDRANKLIPGWMRGTMDVGSGAGGKIAERAGQGFDVAKKDAKFWVELFSKEDVSEALAYTFKAGIPLMYENGKFFVVNAGEAILLPGLSILKFSKWIATGKKDDDVWIVYGKAGAAYFMGKTALNLLTRGQLGIPLTIKDSVITGIKIAGGPIGAMHDAASLAGTGMRQGGKEAIRIRYISQSLPGKVIRNVSNYFKTNLTTTDGMLEAVEAWKHMQRDTEVMEQFSKGMFGLFTETEAKSGANARAAFADSIQQAMKKFDVPKDAPQVLHDMKKNAFAGKALFENEMDKAYTAWKQAEAAKSVPTAKAQVPFASREAAKANIGGFDRTNPALRKGLETAEANVKNLKAAGATGKEFDDAVRVEHSARLRYAEELLGRRGTLLDATGAITADGQKLLDAHHISNATDKATLMKKSKILQELGYGDEEIRHLMRAGITGDATVAGETLARSAGGVRGAEATLEGLSEGEQVLARKMLARLSPEKAAECMHLFQRNGMNDPKTLRLFIDSPRSQKILAGAMKSANPIAEMENVLRAARTARNWRVGFAAVGVTGDVIGVAIAVADILHNGGRIENAMKTGNAELAELYRGAYPVYATQGATSLVGLGIAGYSVYAAGGLMAGLSAPIAVTFAPITLAVAAGAYGHKKLEEGTEYLLKNDKDLLEHSSGTILEHVGKSTEDSRVNWVMSGLEKIDSVDYASADQMARIKGYSAYFRQVSLNVLPPVTELDMHEANENAREANPNAMQNKGEEYRKQLQNERAGRFISDALKYLSHATRATYELATPDQLRDAELFASLCFQKRSQGEDVVVPWATKDQPHDSEWSALEVELVKARREKNEAFAGDVSELSKDPKRFAEEAPFIFLANLHHDLADCERRILTTDFSNLGSMKAWTQWRGEDEMGAIARAIAADRIRAMFPHDRVLTPTEASTLLKGMRDALRSFDPDKEVLAVMNMQNTPASALAKIGSNPGLLTEAGMMERLRQ